jgi:hypothetical protein
MYKRSKKDDYRKRIEEMIGGSQKRSRESSANNNNIDNYNTNISNDTTSIIDCSINDSNDDVVNIVSSDINDSSSGINDNAKNDELNINKIRVQRWNPVSTRVEGIRKYLEANKINLNNLITKLL